MPIRGNEEISFQDFTRNDRHDAQGAQKIRSFCAKAKNAGLDYGWVDTCCINKESSAELTESINSMFQWYKNSAICYAYLNDVNMTEDGRVSIHAFGISEWFRRGWTLQELIAPANLEFLACDWRIITSKHDPSWIDLIYDATKIDKSILRGEAHLPAFSIAQRMSWASGRTTTRVEDMAYCLLGIFDVNMPLLYGEGEKAFIRLQEEIMKDSADQTIFAWERSEDSTRGQPVGLLARSPSDFQRCQTLVPFYLPVSQHDTPVLVTNRGVRFNLPRYTEMHNKSILVLECQDTNGSSGSVVGIGLERKPGGHSQFWRSRPTLFRNIPIKEFRGIANETSYVMKSFVGKESGTTFYEHSIYQQVDPAKAGSKLRALLSIEAPVPKDLLIFFDVVSDERKMDSNIGKIKQMATADNPSFCCYYSRNKSIGKTGFEMFFPECYNWISENYNTGDKVFIFGFSSGAAAAQIIAHMLENIGVLPNGEESIKKAWEVYSRWYDLRVDASRSNIWQEREAYFAMKDFRVEFCKPVGRVQFLGLFDAVYPLSGPTDGDGETFIRQASEHLASLDSVRHAVSIDEPRAALRPILINEEHSDQGDSKSQIVKEMWFVGGHGDIGGITIPQSDEVWPLSHIPLVWMIQEASKAGLKLRLLPELWVNDQGNAQSAIDRAFSGCLTVPFDKAFTSDELEKSLHLAATKGHLHDTPSVSMVEQSTVVEQGKLSAYFSSRKVRHKQLVPENARQASPFINLHDSVKWRRMEITCSYSPVNLQSDWRSPPLGRLNSD